MTEPAVEYRVMWLDKTTGRWWSHTGQLTTTNPAIAEAWREQAVFNCGRSGPTEAVIEARDVTPWARVMPTVPHPTPEDFQEQP